MPSESPLGWKPLSRQTAGPLKGCRILAIRADGKGYYGEVVDISEDYVTLLNGSQWQLLRFHDSPTHFAFIEPPKPKAPRLADRQLFGREHTDGRGSN